MGIGCMYTLGRPPTVKRVSVWSTIHFWGNFNRHFLYRVAGDGFEKRYAFLIRNGHSGPQSTVCPWYITSSDLNSNQVQLFFRNGRQATKGIGMAIWPQKEIGMAIWPHLIGLE